MLRSLALFAALSPLSATTITWPNGNGNWNNVNDWSCPSCSVPTFPDNGNLGNNYQVSIGGSSFVTLNVSPTVDSVSLGAGATLEGSGGVSLAVTGTVSNSGSLYLVDPHTTLQVTGALTNTSAGVSLYNGANLSSGAYSQTGSSTIADGIGTSLQMASFTQDSSSSFHSTNQVVTTVSGAFANNGGSVNLQSGSQLNITGGITNSGSVYLVDPNTVLSAASASDTDGSISLYNSAALKIQGAYSQTASSTLLDGIGTSFQANSFTQDSSSSLHSTNTATTTIASNFSNAGSINLQSGSLLSIGGTLTDSPGSSVFLTDPNTTLDADDISADQSSLTLDDASSADVTADYDETDSTTTLDGIGTSLHTATLELDSDSALSMSNQAHTVATGAVTNGGTINVESGSGLQVASLSNSGSLSIVNNNSTVTASGDITDTGQISNGGSISAATLTLDGGTLSGFGTITAYVVNNGQDQPGDPGVQAITGGYDQGSNGVLSLDLGGLTSYDQLNVTGNVTLAGQLQINLIDGYLPALNNLFTILSVSDGTITGNFSSYVFPVWNGLTFQEIVEPNAVELEVVDPPSDPSPEPGTLILFSAVGLFLVSRALLRSTDFSL